VSCNCKKSCDSRRCLCFKNGLECSIYCHSDDHDCGNMKPVAQRTERSLLPRPAWDNSEASDGGDEGEPAPVQPVQPRRILRAKSVLARTTVNRTASGLAGQHVPALQLYSPVSAPYSPVRGRSRPVRCKPRTGCKRSVPSEAATDGCRRPSTGGRDRWHVMVKIWRPTQDLARRVFAIVYAFVIFIHSLSSVHLFYKTTQNGHDLA